jgi:hypothetical protein
MQMPRPGYKVKSSMSLKQFIAEFGGDFSDRMKEKLLELESRSYLTRKDISTRFDLKHVEHIKFNSATDSKHGEGTTQKEYAYGQFEVNDGMLYFSENCLENNEVIQSPKLAEIYASLRSEDTIFSNGRYLKKLDDNNIQYVVDNILSICPEVSQSYLDIIQGMESRASNK